MPLGTRDVLLMLRAKDQASRIIGDVGRSVDLFNDRLARSNRLTGQEIQRVGQAVMGVGIGLTAVGVMGVAAFWDMTKAAMEYDKQARLTFTQVEKGVATLQQIKQVGRDVALAIPAPFEQMQSSLFDIFSSIDVNLHESEVLLTAFAKAGVAGQVDLQVAGRASIAIMNAFKIPVSEVSRVMDVQFQVVRKGVITYEEFATSIGRAIPSAVKAGQSIEDLGGMMAFLTRNGLSAAMAATSSARALDLLSNPVFASRMKEIGLSVFDANGEFRPMSEVMVDLGQHMKNLPIEERAQALRQLTMGAGGVIQAMRFINLAIADQIAAGKGEVGMLQEMTMWMHNAAGAMEEGYDIMRQTPEVQIQAFKNSVAVLKTEIGDGLLPVISWLAAQGVKLIQFFVNMDAHTKEMIAKFGLFIAVATTVVGILTTMGGALIVVIGVWRQLDTALNIVSSFKMLVPLLQNSARWFAANGVAAMTFANALRAVSIASAIGVTLVVAAEMHQRYQEAVDASREKWTAFVEETRSKVPVPDQIDVLTEALEKQKAELDDLKPKWYEFMSPSELNKIGAAKEAISILNKAIEEGAGSTELGKKAMEELTLAFGEETAQAMKAAAENEEAFLGMSKAAQESATSIKEALMATIDVIEKFGDSATTTAGDLEEFYTTQVRQAENFLSNIQKAYDKGVDPQVLIRAMEAGVTKSGALVEKLAADGSQALIDQVNRGEASLQDLGYASDQMRAQLETGKGALDALGATDAKPTITLDLTEVEQKTIQAQLWIDDLDAQRPVPIADAEIEPLRAKYGQSIDQLNDIHRQRPIPIIDANNNPQRERYLDSMGKLAEINRQRPNPIVSATNSLLQGATNDSLNRLGDVGRQRPNPWISAEASSAHSVIRGVIGALSSLVSRHWTARIRSVFEGNNGGFLPGVSSFAGGSEDHRAQIAAGGAWRVWAEPETGGEAYIPLAMSKRQGSERILGMVANEFGYGLYPLRDAVSAANGRMMTALKSSVPSVNLSAPVRGSDDASRPPSSPPPPATIYEGDTFNFIGRHESPEEIVAAVGFAKKTRGWR